MASPRTSLSDEQVHKNFATKCRDWLRTAEEQQTRAMRMQELVREMLNRAHEMSRPPRLRY